MIVPSIDLMGGNAVQLVGGERLELDAGDPLELCRLFLRTGELAVVDLDAALGQGNNVVVMERLLKRGLAAGANVRVGGGIRTVEAARAWLDRGAARVVLGTAATPDVLRELPAERVVAALDARDGEVVVEGWRKRTGDSIEKRLERLAPYVGGFLVTFVEREGRLGGTDLGRARSLRAAAGDAELVAAGGITTAADVAALDALDVRSQVGMALYKGLLGLAPAIWACLHSDRPDGLVPTIPCDTEGRALGLVYSSAESLAESLATGKAVYQSRRRGLWRKGATSGNVQELLRATPDCNRNALRFTVRQAGAGFCHKQTETCFGAPSGLRALERTLRERRRNAPPGSYAAKLFGDPALLDAKLREEVEELCEASAGEQAVAEAADVLFFTLARLVRDGQGLSELAGELDARATRVSRRPGLAKPNGARRRS